MRTGILTLLCIAAIAAGCGRIEPMRVAATGANVPVVAVLEQTPPGAANLGGVTETTCLNRLWDRRAGWDVALDAVKRQAAARGANALSGVRYEEGTIVLCPSSLKVSATALKLPG